MKTRTDIINSLFEIYIFSRYLEIGVRRPSENFDKIKATIKHSVDPNPKGKYTYNVTSDDFFINCVKNQKYDVIFIDGMHTEEQVYKDVKNSIDHLNENGFIVIHDCNPSNKWLTRTYDDYLKEPGGWNGTVYKAFIKLKYELQNWSCFVVDENYGCGILTQRNLMKNEIVPWDETWDDFDKKRIKLLQLISYENFLNLLTNNNMKNIILKYIKERFGEQSDQQRIKHYSYCKFPQEECSCKDLNEIDYDTLLISGGYIDSFSMIGVWRWLEKTFDVKIPDRSATPDNFNSVKKMEELVKKWK